MLIMHLWPLFIKTLASPGLLTEWANPGPGNRFQASQLMARSCWGACHPGLGHTLCLHHTMAAGD